MDNDGTKIIPLRRKNWITWRDLIISLLKSKDLHEFLYEGGEIPDEENQLEYKASFLIKKNISEEVYYLVRNLERPGEIWKALTQHYASSSKRNIQTRRRELREITIESCSYDIAVYLQRKADAIDQLIGLDINVNDSDMSDSILEGLEKDFRLTDFLFFQSTQTNNDYLKLISDIQVYVNSPSFKMKYRRNKRLYKSNLTLKSKNSKSEKGKYHCDVCGKDGHTADFCYSNPNSKKYKGKKEENKPKIQLNTTLIGSSQIRNMFKVVVLDSGATNHFFGNKQMFVGDIEYHDGVLECASGPMNITGKGKVLIETKHSKIIIDNVLYVPGLTVNLLSLLRLEDKGVRYMFHNGNRRLVRKGCTISDLGISNNLIILEISNSNSGQTDEKDKSFNVHSALGHLSMDKIKHLELKTEVNSNYPCDICEVTKSNRCTRKRKFQKPHRHLYELIHSDICEMPITSVDGYKYFALFIDDCSRYSHIALLRRKSDIYKSFTDLIDEGSLSISTVRSDQGREYLSQTFQSICINNDIRQEFSSTYTPEEIGIAERMNRTLLEKVRPMFLESSLPTTFWSFAVLQANYLYNRSPHSALSQKTPFLVRYGLSENYERLVPFGCKVKRFIEPHKRGKLNIVASTGIMLGYVENTTELLILDFDSCEITKSSSTSKHDPENFPGIPDEVLTNFILKNDETIRLETKRTEEESCSTTVTNETAFLSSETTKIPNNIAEARDGTESEHWMKAADEELNNLKRFDAFEVTKWPVDHQVVSTRFIFSKKYSAKTNKIRYKARLVVRGFEMKCNYGDTFAPTPHLDTLRFVIAYCAQKSSEGFSLFSIDFVSAFLNAVSDPDMYVRPPEGVEIQKGYCWKLKKAVYGSSRAPRLWHKTLEKFLRSIGFERSIADACLYHRKKRDNPAIIYFHVDDLIICSDFDSVKTIIQTFRRKFEIHELGFPSETLGMQIERSELGIRLSCEKSEKKIIMEYEMNEAKPSNTPLTPGLRLPSLHNVENPMEIEKFRQLLGKLLYISRCVRYDISYAVTLLSRYSSKHNKNLWYHLKGILRYLNNQKLVLFYKFNSNKKKDRTGNIHVFSDASYGDDETSKRSTIGNIVLWNEYIISWNSGKTKCVTLSTCESEFMSASEAIRTALFLKKVTLETLNSDLSLKLYIDNQSSIKWLKNSCGYQAQTKHIDIRYHFVREMYSDGLLEIQYLPTDNQIADIFTKPLSLQKHKRIIMIIDKLTSSGEC